jgi:hypothetical protein
MDCLGAQRFLASWGEAHFGARHNIGDVDLGAIVLLLLGLWAHDLVLEMFRDITMLFDPPSLFSILNYLGQNPGRQRITDAGGLVTKAIWSNVATCSRAIAAGIRVPTSVALYIDFKVLEVHVILLGKVSK